jgi:hypothetical protein
VKWKLEKLAQPRLTEPEPEPDPEPDDNYEQVLLRNRTENYLAQQAARDAEEPVLESVPSFWSDPLGWLQTSLINLGRQNETAREIMVDTMAPAAEWLQSIPDPLPETPTPTPYNPTPTSTQTTPTPTPYFQTPTPSTPTAEPTQTIEPTPTYTATPTATPDLTPLSTQGPDHVIESILEGADAILDHCSLVPPLPGEPPPFIDPSFDFTPPGIEADPFIGPFAIAAEFVCTVVGTARDLLEPLVRSIINTEPAHLDPTHPTPTPHNPTPTPTQTTPTPTFQYPTPTLTPTADE